MILSVLLSAVLAMVGSWWIDRLYSVKDAPLSFPNRIVERSRFRVPLLAFGLAACMTLIVERPTVEAIYLTIAAFFLLSKYLGCGVRMYLTAIVMQLLLFDRIGVSFHVNVAVTMLVVWAYTFRGGVRTLVWTDMVQTLAMLSAVVLRCVDMTPSGARPGRFSFASIRCAWNASRIIKSHRQQLNQYQWQPKSKDCPTTPKFAF